MDLQVKNQPVDVAEWETLGLHELCEAFPQMQDEEYEELVKSMEEQGFLSSDPIILIGDASGDNWLILDGQNRRQAAIDAKVEPEFVEYHGKAPATYVMARNMNRRHLTAGQKAAIAAKFATMKQGDNQFRDEPVMTQKQASVAVGVGEASIRRFKNLEEKDPELAAAVASGEISLEEGRKQVTPDKVDQEIDTDVEVVASPMIHAKMTADRLMEKYEIYGVATRMALIDAYDVGANGVVKNGE